jgi:acyl carrier protein
MNIEEFIKKIEAEFPDLQKGVLKPETRFRDEVEWDSINALVIIAMINIEYDVTITAEELINAETVQDVYDIVEKKVLENKEKETDA